MTKEQKEFAQFVNENLNNKLFNSNEIVELGKRFANFTSWEKSKFDSEFEAIRNEVADRKNWLLHEQHEAKKQAQNV